MGENVEDLLEQLSGQQRGFVLGALLHREQAPAALKQLGAELEQAELEQAEFGQACAAAVTTALALDRARRLELTQRLTQQLLCELSEGLERVHPSWMAHLLADQPAALSASVLRVLPRVHQQALASLAGAPASIPVQVALPLTRYLLAPLAPMVTPQKQACTDGRDLLGLGGATLVRTVRCVAALLVSELARQAGAALQARLQAALPQLFDATARRWARGCPPLPSGVLAKLAPDWKAAASTLLSTPSATASVQPPSERQMDGALLPLGIATSALAISRPIAPTLAQQLPRDLGLMLLEAETFGPHDELLQLLRRARRWALEDTH